MLYVIFYGYFAFIMTGHLVESKVGEKGGMGSGKVQELWFELGKCNCAICRHAAQEAIGANTRAFIKNSNITLLSEEITEYTRCEFRPLS